MATDGGRPGSRVVSGVGSQLGGFKKFILRGNVVDLAVGIVIGAAFTGLVQALVKDLITPLIGIFGGIPDFSSWTVTINGSRFLIGDFINTLVSFLILAVVVYYCVVMPVNRLMDKYRPEPQPAPTKECPECLSKIPEKARRCAHCSAQIEPPSEQVAAAMRSVAAPSGEHVADEAARVLVDRLQGRESAGPAPRAEERSTPGSSSAPGASSRGEQSAPVPPAERRV
jgi:large conductance mechanosensitive channel